MPNSKIEIVQQAYAAFGRGDVPAMLSCFSPNVVWTIAGEGSIPYGGVYNGHEGITTFLHKLTASDDIRCFEPREFFAGENKVVVLGYYEAVARSTGKLFQEDWVQVFSFEGDLACSFTEYFDSTLAARAFAA